MESDETKGWMPAWFAMAIVVMAVVAGIVACVVIESHVHGLVHV